MKRHIFCFEIKEVVPFIDWSYFLHAWGIARKGTQADEIISDAKAMLNELDGKYRTSAIFALCDAKGNGDDIIIEETTLPLLQVCSTAQLKVVPSKGLQPHLLMMSAAVMVCGLLGFSNTKSALNPFSM